MKYDALDKINDELYVISAHLRLSGKGRLASYLLELACIEIEEQIINSSTKNKNAKNVDTTKRD